MTYLGYQILYFFFLIKINLIIKNIGRYYILFLLEKIGKIIIALMFVGHLF